MKITSFIFYFFIILFNYINSAKIRNAAITVVIENNDNHIETIKCPRKLHAARSDHRRNGVIVSLFQANFVCEIIFVNKIAGESPLYHIRISPQFNASLVGCKQFHDCYNLEITQEKARNINFHIEASSTCLEEVLKFTFELRKQHNLIHVSETNLFIGRFPPTPTHLDYVWKHNTVFLIGNINSICKNIFLSSKYFVEFKIESLGSMVSNKTSCQIEINNESYEISCKLLNFDNMKSSNMSICGSKAIATVSGVSKEMAIKVPMVSSLLAVDKMNGLKLIVSRRNLTSLTLKLDSNIECNDSSTNIKLVIQYHKITTRSKQSVYTTCDSFHNCQLTLVGLLKNTKYNVCIYQQDIFEKQYVHSKTSCIVATTIELPCIKSFLVNTTKTAVGSMYWEATLYMVKGCDKENVFTLVEVVQNNSSLIFNKTFSFNGYSTAKGFIKNLHILKHYMLVLSSCNQDGCRKKPGIYLQAPSENFIQNNADSLSNEIIKKRLLSVVIICLSSVLMIAICCFLIHVLKRRSKKKFSLPSSSSLPSQDLNDLIPKNSTLV